MVKKYILFFVFLISVQFASAQTAKVTASTDTSEYLIGDPIHFTIQVEVGKDFQVIPPAIKDSIAGLEILNQLETKIATSENNKTITFQYLLAGYDSLQVIIPSLEISVKGKSDTADFSVFTNLVELNVHKVQIDTTQEIKDVKAPITIPLDWRIVATIILGAAIVIALAVFLYKKYKKKKAGEIIEEEIIILPPDVTALNSLKELEAKKLWQNGKIKEYHSDITGIIRKYFEGRFNFPALELTTSEVLYKLNSINGAGKISNLTSDFLNNADLVKFAKYKPMNEINEEMMQQAYKIVEDTKTEINPVAELNNVQ
jgi:hypothetical protein